MFRKIVVSRYSEFRRHVDDYEDRKKRNFVEHSSTIITEFFKHFDLKTIKKVSDVLIKKKKKPFT